MELKPVPPLVLYQMRLKSSQVNIYVYTLISVIDLIFNFWKNVEMIGHLDVKQHKSKSYNKQKSMHGYVNVYCISLLESAEVN